MLKKLEKFHQLSPVIFTWIDRISKEKWSMAYDNGGRRYSHMTTNLSECVNKVLKDCRNLPITALVKSTYSRCRKYFVDRGRRAQRQLHEVQVYCSKVVKKLKKIKNKLVRTSSASMISTRQDVVYTNEHILKAYFAQWWPLGNEAAIPPSDEPWTLILNPTTIRAKGRPKSIKIRNEMDWLEPSEHQQKCSRCGREGHNRRRCPMQSECGSVSIGTSCYCERVIVGHEKFAYVSATPPNEYSLADVSL
ncbi:hypothetical protein GmHk_08G022593 [Glycine max]|nr:hypothetical protein GmHk_08G022593 [Glycine max]